MNPDTLVKVVLVFFLSLLSFSVGTFIGKQVSDADHQKYQKIMEQLNQ